MILQPYALYWTNNKVLLLFIILLMMDVEYWKEDNIKIKNIYISTNVVFERDNEKCFEINISFFNILEGIQKIAWFVPILPISSGTKPGVRLNYLCNTKQKPCLKRYRGNHCKMWMYINEFTNQRWNLIFLSYNKRIILNSVL